LPNGDPEFHLKEEPELETFFRPIADALTAFARQHNLKLEKYYHQSPSWSFTFRHPQGGVAKIQVCRESAEAAGLLCFWWYDEYDQLTRHMKNSKGKSKSVSREPEALTRELEECLKLVVSWQFGTWDEHCGGYDSWKKTWTKQQFDALLDSYPTLKA
jgi:hypothetical protein